MPDPLVFDTYYRPQIWGGRGLKNSLGRELPDDGPYGEAWDLSAQKMHVSRVCEGPLTGQYLNEFWRNLNRSECEQFPLLIKWLECRSLLSLQVHPDDRMAQRVLNEPYGKSEAWLVVAVEPTARVYAGLKPGVTRDIVKEHIRRGTLSECLHSFTPKVGDCISLPAGTIHAAGGGLIVAEVQQSSDATFRLYDWDRPGLDGKPRPLQIELALEATDWTQGPVSPVIPTLQPTEQRGVLAEKLVDGAGFRLERYFVTQSLVVPHSDELTIWMTLAGSGELTHPENGYRRIFGTGSTTVLPPGMSQLSWKSVNSDTPLTLLCVRLSPINQ